MINRQSYLIAIQYFLIMSCSYCGAKMGDSEFCPKCKMIKIEYDIFSKLKKYLSKIKK